MKIMPAIDLIDNKCVRLYKGDYNQMKVYSDDPPAMARTLEEEGADIIHVVDLSGAKEGKIVHGEMIRKIQNAVSIPIEVGGGVRSFDDVNLLLDASVRRLILGSALIKNRDFAYQLLEDYPEYIILGIDGFGNKVAIHGWQETTELLVADVINEYRKFGLQQVIYTDIHKDGALRGPNIDMLQYLCEHTDVQLIASGGITSLKDVRMLLPMEEKGLFGFILGKAVYEGLISIVEVKEIVDAEF